MDQGLHYQKCEESILQLEAYSDADWAADKDDRRSRSGYCFSLIENGPVILWKSKKQPTVALSICEVYGASSHYSREHVSCVTT